MSSENSNEPVQSDAPIFDLGADQNLDLPVESELDALKARATLLGIPFRPNIGLDSLRAKVNAVIEGTQDDEPTDTSPKEPVVVKSKQQLLNEQRREANTEARKLVRIVLTAKDPLKRELEAEYFTVSNRLIGTIKRLVPFANEEGWHVEQAIVNMIKDKEVQLFKTVKLPNGDKVRKGYMSKAYTVEILDPLTKDELAALATQQAARNSIGD